MAKLFWLASYPKSGNTWVRILLAHCRQTGPDGIDIDRLGHYGLAGAFSRQLFDQYCAIKSSTLPPHIIERLRPALYRAMAAKTAEDMPLKVHDAWRLTDQGEPVFPAEITGGVIYLLRNVLDVAPSLADHYGTDIATAVDRLCDPDHGLALSRDSLLTTLPQPMGSWSSHIESWLDASGLPVLLVRYEDLLTDTAAMLTQIVNFLGWQVSADTIAHAVAQSRFATLQAREREHGFREKTKVAHTRFFRRGQAGSWRDELPAPLARRLIDVHGNTLRRFGYLDDTANPME